MLYRAYPYRYEALAGGLQIYLLSTSLAWSVRKKWRSENKGLRLSEIWSLTVGEV
ncbi:hypothetical protein ACRAST_11870 [Bacteroides hominis]|uniref:hypothetical protein n=1 Tax=Bacteroides hominis TaxID=2763023 RepID=UPI0001B4AA53